VTTRAIPKSAPPKKSEARKGSARPSASPAPQRRSAAASKPEGEKTKVSASPKSEKIQASVRPAFEPSSTLLRKPGQVANATPLLLSQPVATTPGALSPVAPFSLPALPNGFQRFYEEAAQSLHDVLLGASTNGGGEGAPDGVRSSETKTDESVVSNPSSENGDSIAEVEKRKTWPGALPRNGLSLPLADLLHVDKKTLADLRQHHYLGMTFRTAAEYESKENAIRLKGVRTYFESIKDKPLSSSLIGHQSLRPGYDFLLGGQKTSTLISGSEISRLFNPPSAKRSDHLVAASRLLLLFKTLSGQIRLIDSRTGKLAMDEQDRALWTTPLELTLSLLPSGTSVTGDEVMKQFDLEAASTPKQVRFAKDVARAVIETLNRAEYLAGNGLGSSNITSKRGRHGKMTSGIASPSDIQRFFGQTGANLSAHEREAFYALSHGYDVGELSLANGYGARLFKQAYQKLSQHPLLRRRPSVLARAAMPTPAERFFRLGPLYWWLSPRQQEMLLLQSLGLSRSEIAKIANSAPHTVENILHSARLRIQEYKSAPNAGARYSGLFDPENAKIFGTDFQIQRRLGPLFYALSPRAVKAYVMLQTLSPGDGLPSAAVLERIAKTVDGPLGDPKAIQMLLSRIKHRKASAEQLFIPSVRIWVPPYLGWPLAPRSPVTRDMRPTDKQLRGYFGEDYMRLTPRERELMFLSEVYSAGVSELAGLFEVKPGTITSALDDASKKLGDPPKIVK
jgi:DNA-directed RNA polymerase specialized sigma24 family protein